MTHVTSIAGAVDLSTVLADLSSRRPVFHSEADLQFALAQAIAAADPDIQVRLEVRQPGDRAEYVDLVCAKSVRRTLIELKYATTGWVGKDPSGERFQVKHHAAYDLARRYFIHDVSRLERFTSEVDSDDGIALMLTNEPGLWNPRVGRRITRDAQFRIHEGRVLEGKLRWGNGGSSQFDQKLTGSYPAVWRDYSNLEGPRGQFRWLALPVGHSR